MTTPCPFEEGLIPPDEIGPFLPVSQQEVAVFNELFSDDLDSGFASSICCCDFCYDDFKEHWPDVAFREMEFQTQSMGAFWAVEYSRLPGTYSPAEISTLGRLVQCPRCLEYGACNIWVYEHRFGNAEEIEEAIDELRTLGSTTPFLLLEHPFAQDVLKEIRQQAAASVKTKLDMPLYRARFADDVEKCGQEPGNLQTYGAPPAAYVGEGRFNHAGGPMLYLASSADIAAAELGQPEEPCFVGTLRLLEPLRILDLAEIDDENAGYELLRALAASALIAAPRTGHGWVKRQYVFSRFVGDCARSAGFDAIRYRSMKREDGSNYVLLNPPEDASLIFSLKGNSAVRAPAPAKRY